MLKMGSGAKAKSVSLGLIESMKTSAPAVNTIGVRGVHDARADQHAHGVQVVGGARHDVAGAGALIEAVREPLQVREEIVAQIELDFARDADQDPARQILEDGLDGRDSQQQQRIFQNVVANHRRAVDAG